MGSPHHNWMLSSALLEAGPPAASGTRRHGRSPGEEQGRASNRPWKPPAQQRRYLQRLGPPSDC
eukprot:12023566-Heterocapsa_arctica.AAC.1